MTEPVTGRAIVAEKEHSGANFCIAVKAKSAVHGVAADYRGGQQAMSVKDGLQFRTLMRVSASLAAVLLAAQVSGGVAQRLSASMLDRLEPGQWTVRDRAADGTLTRLCIDSGRRLVQIRHQNETCRSVVVEDTASSVTIAYTCPRTGYGQTRIRFENPHLAQLDTQGIANGLPFEFSAEARRIGNCAR